MRVTYRIMAKKKKSCGLSIDHVTITLKASELTPGMPYIAEEIEAVLRALLQKFGGPVKMGLHTSGAGHVRFQVASF